MGHTRRCKNASEALDLYAERRTYDGKGVTIPSQIRYVHHYALVVKEGQIRPTRWLRLVRIEITLQFEEDWTFQVMTHEDGLLHDSGTDVGVAPLFNNDVKIAFFSKDQ